MIRKFLIASIALLALPMMALATTGDMTTPKGCSVTAITHNLDVGSTGTDVVRLQEFLVTYGFLNVPEGATLGYFGSVTKAAVSAYQISKGISANGSYGPITRESINAFCGNNTVANPISIKVLSPNGGETFTEGQPVNITWSSNLPPTQDMNVALYFGNRNLGKVIIEHASNAGSIMWTAKTPEPMVSNESVPPQTFFPDGTYRVVVACSTGSCQGTSNNFDTSDSVFTIKSTSTPAYPVANISVNGSHNVTLNVGDAYNYQWSSTNGTTFSSTYTGMPSSCGSGAMVANSASGTWNGAISASQAGCTYVINYMVTNKNGTAKDIALVNVNGSAPSCTAGEVYSSTTGEKCPPNPTLPVAVLRFNGALPGTHDFTVNIGDPISYQWLSTNGTTFSSTYTGTPSSCGSGTSVANTANGTWSGTVPASQAGCTYQVRYNVGKLGATTATDYVNMTVNKPVVQQPTASITVNGSHNVTLNVGDPYNYQWSSTNGTTFSSTYTGTPSSCGSGAMVANSASGTWNGAISASQAGCTYVIKYNVGKPGATTAIDTGTVTVNNQVIEAYDASITANGSHDITVNPGDNVTYIWKSSSATTYAATVVPGVAGCDYRDVVINASTANGSSTQPAPAHPGCVYTITYTVRGDGNHYNSQPIYDTVTLRIRGTLPPPPPAISSDPTANLTINGAHTISVNVGDTVKYEWSSTNGTTFSSTYAGTPSTCLSGPWMANTANNTHTGVIPTSIAGCTYVLKYNVGKAGATTATDTVIVTVKKPIAMYFTEVMNTASVSSAFNTLLNSFSNWGK